MTTRYAKGGYIHTGQITGAGYDPDTDGPLHYPNAMRRRALTELDRLNSSG